MLIPLRVDYAFQRRHWALFAIILVNMAIFIATIGLRERWVPGYALDRQEFALHQLVTHQFMHAGIFHLIGNMLFLWVYGQYVEERIGPWKFVGLYLLAGIFAGIVWVTGGGRGRLIGASGAIAGIMGFVLVLAPFLEVKLVLYLRVKVSDSFPVAVIWLLVPWILLQLWYSQTWRWSGVAFEAHIAGFVVGAAAAGLMRSSYAKGTHWYLEEMDQHHGKGVLRRLWRARGARKREDDDTK